MIIPIEYNNEQYREITQEMVPGVDIGRYYVSNYGTVYDSKRDCQISQNEVGDGYIGVMLHVSRSDRSEARLLVHRLVAMAFVNGNWSLQVNHKDGNKRNEYYENLEFVTPRENLMHALDMGLNHRGEKKVNAILTNEQVHSICKYLEQGYDYKQIIDILNLSNIKNIDNILHDIKCKKSWTFISCNYKIPEHKIVNNRMLSRDQVAIICEKISKDPKVSNKELFDAAGIDVSTKEKYDKMRHCIESIKSKKAYTDISQNYNI